MRLGYEATLAERTPNVKEREKKSAVGETFLPPGMNDACAVVGALG